MMKDKGGIPMSEDRIREMIAANPVKGRLGCAVAHYIAAYLKVEPSLVGSTATRMGVKIDQCQLGLFGYGRKGISGYKIVGRKVEVGDAVLEAIKEASDRGRISCLKLWEIAEREGIARAEAGNAADALGIKISPCQLGAF